MKGYRGGSLLLVLCLLLAASSALAQTTVSTIEGTIKDAPGKRSGRGAGGGEICRTRH